MTVQLQKFPQPIQAVWNEANREFKKIDRIVRPEWTRYALYILSILLFPLMIAKTVGYAIGFAAKKLVLPSAWFYPNQILQRAKRIFQICCVNLQKQFEIQKHKVMTPDGVKLNLLYFRHRRGAQGTANSFYNSLYRIAKRITPPFLFSRIATYLPKSKLTIPTVLFYQSNASISQLGIYLWLVEESVRRNKPCNFVVFDYRGVGSSQGDAKSTKDLLIDGDAALQFVKDHLKVPPHLINFYTWSLGGGVGTNVKARHPECTGRLVSERSFSSLKDVAKSIIPSALKPFLFWLPDVAEKKGWDLRAPLEKLKGKTMIVYHKEDPTIPYEASAHKAAMAANLPVESGELELIAKNPDRAIDHHFEELQNYIIKENGKRADQAIADFILEAE